MDFSLTSLLIPPSPSYFPSNSPLVLPASLLTPLEPSLLPSNFPSTKYGVWQSLEEWCRKQILKVWVSLCGVSHGFRLPIRHRL